ncbi:MAG: CrcB family protein [Oligoflexales bacterium]
MSQWFFVALGGAIGAILRGLIQHGLEQLTHNFPLGTFTVNALGCFLAGLFIPFWPLWSAGVKAFIITGFLGALTTYSSFAVDFVNLFTGQKTTVGFSYLGLTIVLCIGLCFLGYSLGQKLAT